MRAKADFSVCVFSSEREVAFCGHATIAIMYDLISNDISLQTRQLLSIETRTDLLQIENRYPDEKCVYISAPSPKFSKRIINADEIAIALKCDVGDIGKTKPIQIINAGLETLVVPMAGLSNILSISPDIYILKQFCLNIDVDIILLYSSEVANKDCQYRTRVFAPTFGYLEDPATGSGNSAFGYYLQANKFWTDDKIRIEQNAFFDSPNFVKLIAKKSGSNETRIWFGGGAKVKIDGHYILD